MSYRNVEIDFDGLEHMAKFVEEEVEKVSKTTKQTILEQNPAVQPGDEADYDVSDDEGAEAAPEPSPGETPPEIRERIEFLFEAAAKDLSKAGDLKDELDHWGLFQEYEDRFLDLFGKRNL
jgi:hypothetical protein